MKYYIIDAFADEQYQGNPAGVCILEENLPDEQMQSIAFKNNLAETAFLLAENNEYKLRWFTPLKEVDLCGHATLATAFVMLNYIQPNLTSIDFQTKSGKLSVSKENDLFTLDFPSRMPVSMIIPDELKNDLSDALSCKILELHLSRDLLVLVESEKKVQNLKLDMDLLSKVCADLELSIIVTAKGTSCDFVSRFFAPGLGVHEDPVTGSAHSTLIPFWSKRLGKTKMQAKQLSPRGGALICEDLGTRVHIGGKAICSFTGEIEI